MATGDDDYRFSVEDGCVVLEIFGDSEDEENENSYEDGETCETDADHANYDCGADSLVTNGYSSDTSSLTVNSEITTNKSKSDPPSRHLSKEPPTQQEDQANDLLLDMQVTEDNDFSLEADDEQQPNKDNVICIQPDVNFHDLQEDSCDDFTNDDSENMYDDNELNEDNDLTATNQALSLNELFKQYGKDRGKSDAHSHFQKLEKSHQNLNIKSCSQDNFDNVEQDAADGVTEYFIGLQAQDSLNKIKIVEAKTVSDHADVPVIDATSVTIKQEVLESDVKAGEIYDRKRPNLRRLPRINMAEDDYFNSKLKVIDKPYLNDSKLKKLKTFVRPQVTKFNGDKAKRTWSADRVQCDICEGWFAGTQSLNVHMRIHKNEKPYACDVCGWRSRTSSAHSLHMKLHSKDKQFPCPVCDMKFYTSTMLKSHSRVHSGERPYQCSYCPDSFAHSSTLKVHIRQHTKERPYACTICDKRFAQPTHLTTHLRTHTQEKPFECKFCGKRMRQSSHLKIHLRIHTQERPYECDQCTANFMTKEHLVMHKRTHSGDHPYPCRICGAAFTQSSARKKHEKRHEEGVQYQCDICFVDCISPRALKRHKKTHDISEPKTKTEPAEDADEIEEEIEAEIEEESEQENEEEIPGEEMEEQGEEFNEEFNETEIKLEVDEEAPTESEAPALQVGRKSCKKKNPLQCDICFKVFARIPNVTRHKMEIHAGFKRSTWAHTFVRNNFDKVKKHLNHNYYK